MAASSTDEPLSNDDNKYHTRLDLDTQSSLSIAVIEALARAKGVDATELDVPLYERIDTEALEALYHHSRGTADEGWTLSFPFDEFTVTVRGDGRITVE